MNGENRFCPQGPRPAGPEPPLPRAARKQRRRKQSWGGMSSRIAEQLGSDPQQRAPACCRLRSPCFPAHLEQARSLEVCHRSHALAPALAPASSQCGPMASFLLPPPPPPPARCNCGAPGSPQLLRGAGEGGGGGGGVGCEAAWRLRLHKSLHSCVVGGGWGA